MANTCDVVVVGAGVMGSSIALELARTGRSVVVVDKTGGAGHGSTGASSAIVRFSYSTLAGVATAWEAKSCWEHWEDHLGFRDPLGLAGFRRTGMLHLDVPVVPREHSLRLYDQVGIGYEEYDADHLVARFPFLDNGRYWPNKPITDEAFWSDSTGTIGGYYVPEAGFVTDPQLAANNLAVAAQHFGASFRFHAHVTALNPRAAGGWLTTLADGERIESAVVVNAAGPWSSAVNRLAGVGDDFTVAVRPMRQEVHQVAAPPGYNRGTELGPVIADLDLGTYMRPGPHDVLWIGGTEPECDGYDWVDDPDAADPRPTRTRFEAQVTRAARRLPGLTVPSRPKGIAGVYDVAEDWTPIYDRTDADGFYVAMGTSGNQFKNAPLVGRFLTTIIDADEGTRSRGETGPQYVGEHTGHRIDLSTYARNRARNTASSGTVMG